MQQPAIEERERLSAFMDGESDSSDTVAMIGACRAQVALREDWAAYHCIGDVLRSQEMGCHSARLYATVAERLADEPHHLPARSVAGGSRLARRAGSIAAGLAAIAAVAFVALPQWRDADQPIAAALQPAATGVQRPAGQAPDLAVADPVAGPGPAVIPPVAREYIAAHRQYSAGLAMQGVVGRVRNVAYESGN
ncbi:MAG: sigma-E factor negative regulatory protein [Burkholderiales bacterium]|nr:sigma-E factor negative regulatory protein [Burkholderiales bacterium]